MSDVIRIELDGGVPTEPGFYFRVFLPPMYSDSWAFVEVVRNKGVLVGINSNGCGTPVNDALARWSRRIEIQGA